MSLRKWMRVLSTNHRDGRNLTSDESFQAFDQILAGDESDIGIASFLVAMSWKGVSVEELTGFAKAARARANIPCAGMPGLVTICPPHDGTERVPPLEVAAGLIAAGAGARVLIVSDQGVPPRRGVTAASALEGLDVNMTWDPMEAEEWVAKARFGVVSLAGMLPSIMPLRKIRDQVGIRTPLSTVEKLISPPESAVVVGAQSGPVLGKAVEVLQALGHPRAIALQGLEGGVVPSLRRRTRGIEASDAHLVPIIVEPDDFGLGSSEEPELPFFGPPDIGKGTGDNPELLKASSNMTQAVLVGEQGPIRNASILAAAVMLRASGRSMTLAEGVDAATTSLDTGNALSVLDALRNLSH